MIAQSSIFSPIFFFFDRQQIEKYQIMYGIFVSKIFKAPMSFENIDAHYQDSENLNVGRFRELNVNIPEFKVYEEYYAKFPFFLEWCHYDPWLD